ncbi:FAD-dependent monooxygenase [Spiractinospora alimapuensis]|uniref:FAD-dependent monooxygenase n=1 Tax=Spiractinospora alimapuensis TaxID=2820884 RepID=UPI001F1E9637|nr:FAD-dependent monooxygenase [Spiractinospora alimapuensis]QVQ52741.1 FAD-dependent monooxygenase [Spiractinospora alimapuensis]
MRVLISGASVAGPVLAYWLHRYGFECTVLERAPALRKTGGHAVDLLHPAMDIIERMGLREEVLAKTTGTESLTLEREGSTPIDIDISRILGPASENHAEVMRDDLGEIFYDATRAHVEYVFGDSIATLEQHPTHVHVTFDHGDPRDFDLVIGADGLHSNTRRIVFGDESQFAHFIGGYLSVLTVPNHLDLSKRMVSLAAPGRTVGLYSADRADDARAIFLFRSENRLDYHHRDTDRQKELLRAAFADIGWEVPRLLAELDHTPAFYFDEITQLRMDHWSRGRVGLVGDAAYSPGPAIGGSTSLAVVGAYVLAGELATAWPDHERGFTAYERELADYVERSRTFARRMAKQLIPDTAGKVWLLAQVTRLVGSLPAGVARVLSRLDTGGLRVHDEVRLKDYPALIGPRG